MKISLSGRKLIQRHSGLRMNAYKGRAGVWMIGYGSIRWPSGKLVSEGDKLTSENEAQELFDYSIQSPERIVNSHIKVRLTQNQYDALVSLVYDLKGNNFNDSGIVELINEGNYADAGRLILSLNNKSICSLVAGTRSEYELAKRRQSEYEVFKML